MKVNVTSFNNPFSFFCVIRESFKEVPSLVNDVDKRNVCVKKSISDVNHGQYVAVLWKNKWTRGVITMESHFLIWLVDYGIHIHPDEKTVYVDLPIEYKKHPTKVFEAAIHGVVPIDKYISNDFQIDNKVSALWNKGAIQKCQELIRESTNIYLDPVALMSLNFNDIVLADLYLEIQGKKLVNLVDELELWPVFLEKNKPVYIENLSKYYITRRRHHVCNLKPEFADGKLQVVTTEMTLEEYTTLIENQSYLCQQMQMLKCTEDSADGDTDDETEVQDNKYKNAYRLTPAEIEKYSNLYITIHGHKYNVLNILVNKARDLRMCERYKDLKSIGRGFSFRRSSSDDNV